MTHIVMNSMQMEPVLNAFLDLFLQMVYVTRLVYSAVNGIKLMGYAQHAIKAIYYKQEHVKLSNQQIIQQIPHTAYNLIKMQNALNASLDQF